LDICELFPRQAKIADKFNIIRSVCHEFADHTPSLPDARPRSDRFRCGGRESKFLAVGKIAVHG